MNDLCNRMRTVTAAIIRKGTRVLLTRRSPGERHEGYWEFPGGKLETGETLEECLEREILEELGVESVVGDVITTSDFTYEYGSIRLIALKTTIGSEMFSPTSHDLISWVELTDLPKYKLLPADVPIAQYLQNGD